MASAFLSVSYTQGQPAAMLLKHLYSPMAGSVWGRTEASGQRCCERAFLEADCPDPFSLHMAAAPADMLTATS